MRCQPDAAGASDELLFALVLDAVLLHLLVERRAVDAQQAGRVLAVPAVGFQGVDDDLPLRLGSPA
jgi:hypothetical protein